MVLMAIFHIRIMELLAQIAVVEIVMGRILTLYWGLKNMMPEPSILLTMAIWMNYDSQMLSGIPGILFPPIQHLSRMAVPWDCIILRMEWGALN